MKYAEKQANEIVYAPFEEKFLEENRYFQGCPSVAVTPAGSELFSELCEWDKSIVVDEDPSTMTAEGVAKLLATICSFISG